MNDPLPETQDPDIKSTPRSLTPYTLSSHIGIYNNRIPHGPQTFHPLRVPLFLFIRVGSRIDVPDTLHPKKDCNLSITYIYLF